jgi:phytanoyl-CoA hydroxylase
LGYEVANFGSSNIRTKLPGSVITSFPWHQDSQYIDQVTIGEKEKHTQHLHMVTVWVPLVEATIENGCCWVMPGSHRWGLLDGARGEYSNIRMEEDIEARGTPVPVPIKPGGVLFLSNLCAHTSKLNTTRGCRWSIDFRYFPIPGRAPLSPVQNKESEFVQNKILKNGGVPLIVLTKGGMPTWEEWEGEILKQRVLREA